MENEFVEFDRGITQMRNIIPDLPNKRWKVKREGAWSATRNTVVPFV
jgi:hypothetical protein